jgi:16S rRNA (guanine527-N7)-methyltransferase
MFHVEPGLAAAGIQASGEFVEKARKHLEEVYRWNKVHDLTAVAPDQAVERHLVDSILPFLGQEAPATLLDVGTGAGFPGIFVALWWPQTKVTLCEPLRKRRSFLETACARLDLNCDILSDPVEKLTGQWNMVTSRATLPWRILLSSCADRVEGGGRLLGLLGPDQAPRMGELQPDSTWQEITLKPYSLPSGAQRITLLAHKCST